MGAISRDEAIALATKGLTDLGRDPSRYEMSVTETGSEWQVTFSGKQPRAPGDEVFFYVDKSTRKVRSMLGE